MMRYLFILLITVTLLCFGTFASAGFSKKWNSELKDVDGSEMVTSKDGAMYIIATGEEIESKDSKSGHYVLISSDAVQAVSNKTLSIKFKDGSIRTWSIADSTAVCDENGAALKRADIVVGSAYSVRWTSENIGEAIKSAKQRVALSVRKGKLRYKVGEPSGRMITSPEIANHSCLK